MVLINVSMDDFMRALHSRNEPMVVYLDRDLIKTPVEAIIPRVFIIIFLLITIFSKTINIFVMIRYQFRI